MNKNQIVLLEDRGIVSISGIDAKDFLQNIISNDIEKVKKNRSIFSAIFTPQGKYLFEFFIIKMHDGFFLDCDHEFTNEIIKHLSKYKIRSKVEIKDLSSNHVIGVINLEKFREIQIKNKEDEETIFYRDCPIFVDPRKNQLGARILSNLEKLHLTIKKLDLNVIDNKNYLEQAYTSGIPIKGVKHLKDQLFGLEANLEELNAIDFKKGCYVGQENTARMKLKNRIRKRLLPIKVSQAHAIGSNIFFEDKIVGKILISKPYPFALIKVFEPNLETFINEDLFVNKISIRIIKPNFF